MSMELWAGTLFSGRQPEPGIDGSFVPWFILPASLMKSMYLLMIIRNQNSMNKVVNSPNKRQRLHQQNPQADTGIGSALPGDC